MLARRGRLQGLLRLTRLLWDRLRLVRRYRLHGLLLLARLSRLHRLLQLARRRRLL